MKRHASMVSAAMPANEAMAAGTKPPTTAVAATAVIATEVVTANPVDHRKQCFLGRPPTPVNTGVLVVFPAPARVCVSADQQFFHVYYLGSFWKCLITRNITNAKNNRLLI